MPSHKIHIEAFAGNTEAIARLLVSNPEIINILNDNGETPVFLACHRGHILAVELLAEKGADLSIPDCHGITPLHRVIGIIVRNKGKDAEVHHKIVEIILQKNIRLMTIRDQSLRYPLYELHSYQEAMDRVLLIIKKLGKISQILPAFIADLHHKDALIQQSAAITLSRICQIIPETQQEILQAFMQFFHDEQNPHQWIHVTKALYSIMQMRLNLDQTILQQIISTFIGYLTDKTIPYTVKIDSVGVLGEICKINPETSASQIIPALIKILNTDNITVKKKVSDTLSSIGKAMLPQKIFEIIQSFVQPLNSQTESLVVRKHAVDVLVSICVAIPEIAPQIISTFKNSLEIKAESDELKTHIISSLQMICGEIVKTNEQKALEVALQIKPIFEQALRNESLSLKFKQHIGGELAKMYLAIPDLEPKKTQSQTDKIAAEPAISNPLPAAASADGQQTKCEQETSLRSDSFSASSSDSSSPLLPRFFDSQKQPLLGGLTHRNVPSTTPSDG